MSYFDVYLFLSCKLSEAFPWSKFKDRVHEFVLLAPMETPDSFDKLYALIFAQEDCFAIFIFLFFRVVYMLVAEKVR